MCLKGCSSLGISTVLLKDHLLSDQVAAPSQSPSHHTDFCKSLFIQMINSFKTVSKMCATRILYTENQFTECDSFSEMVKSLFFSPPEEGPHYKITVCQCLLYTCFLIICHSVCLLLEQLISIERLPWMLESFLQTSPRRGERMH